MYPPGFAVYITLGLSKHMSAITVRQAVLSDLEALVPLFDNYRQFYGRTSDVAATREFLSARFNHGESVLSMAHEADSPAGFVQLYPSFSSVSLARIFILNDIFVPEHCRKKYRLAAYRDGHWSRKGARGSTSFPFNGCCKPSCAGCL